MQIDHRNPVARADGLYRIHVIPESSASTVGNVIVCEFCAKDFTGSKAIPVQRCYKYDFAGRMLGNKSRNNGIQRTVEGSVLRVRRGTQRRFVSVVIGAHENDDEIGRGNALIAVDQRLVFLTVIRSGADAGATHTHRGHRVKSEIFVQILVILFRRTHTGGNAVTHKHGTSAVPRAFLLVRFPGLPHNHTRNLRIGKPMGIGSHIGEHEVLAGQPIRGGILVIRADVVMVHRSDLLPVYGKVDHVGAILGDAVLQAVGMQSRPVDAVVGQGDAIVMAARRGLFAHGDDAVGVTLENIAGVVMGVHVVRREKPCAASAVGIQEGSLARPLHYPGQVMAQNRGICQGITGLIEHAVHGGSRILGQGVVTADTEQIRPVELPAVAFGLVYALSGDDHVICHGGNGNRAVLVGRRGDVLPSHGHGDM